MREAKLTLRRRMLAARDALPVEVRQAAHAARNAEAELQI